MSYRIEVKPEINPTRIEAWCEIPGWRGEQSVIVFSIVYSDWHVASSMCMPSDIEAAKQIQECVAAAFEKLAELTV